MIVTILWLLCFNVLILYTFLVWTFDYWKKRGVSGPKPKPFVGNFPSAFTQRRHMACDIQDIYESHKHTDNFVGVYNSRTPQLMITNSELIRRILVTDFKYFHDNDASTMFDDKSDFIFANNPFALTGDEWRERRAEATPGFTTHRIKTAFPISTKVCKTLLQYIEKQIKIGAENGIDGKDLSLRFTSEVVTDCVFGLKANSFSKKPMPILDNTKKIFDQSFIAIVYKLLVGLMPTLKKYKKFRMVPIPIEKFFVKLMQNALDSRKSQMRKGANRNRMDFLNYMIQLQEKKGLTLRELTAHSMTFLLDGFEITSEVLSHCLLTLGRDIDRQKILRREIVGKLGDSNDFEAISNLPYLDACIHETLRIFSPAAFTTKVCTESIDLVNKNGGLLKVAVGTPVILPLQAVMKDDDYYENPENFEPERFLEGRLKQFQDNGHYLAFGDGPRICLGMRYALMQIKAALVEIIRNYEVRINPKTRSDNKLDPTYLLSRLDGGIWLEFNKI